MPRPSAAPRGAQSLAQGLAVLRLLAEAKAPMTATAIAAAIDVSVSTASRTLGALTAAGYVRKPDFHAFAIAIGALTLAGNARHHFPQLAAARAPMQALAQAVPGLRTALATVHDGQLVYFLQTALGEDPVELAVGGYPLHLSSPGLRLLLARPEREALAALRGSRRRYGWERPGPATPADEPACLAAARAALDDDCLVLRGWQAEERVSAALPVPARAEPPLALALVGPAKLWTAARRTALARAASEIATALG